MKRQLPDAVTCQLDVRLVVPGDAGVPLPVTLRYDPADPYAVYATFRTPDGSVEWVFARELLTLVYYGCATDTSAPWPTVRWRREHLGRSTRAVAQLSDPRISAWSPS